jgi:hypothetical protein
MVRRTGASTTGINLRVVDLARDNAAEGSNIRVTANLGTSTALGDGVERGFATVI